MFGTKCPKCGLVQMANPVCKSCGAALQAPASRPSAGPTPRPSRAPAAPRRPTPASPPPPLAPAPPQAIPRVPSFGGPANRSRRLSFHGAGGSLFGIHVVNIFLTIVTLGIYYFWGKVRVRSYLLSETEFEGDRFAYHGTGKELLVGFLKAMLVFGLPLGVLSVLRGDLLDVGVVVQVVAGVLAYALIMVFAPVAMVGARRYRLSRTSWREIRFSFRGRAGDFLKIFLKASLLTALTFGLYYPFFDTKRYAFMTSHAYLGNQKFDFDGEGRDLFWPFVLTLLLTIPTLGVCWYWFLAKKQRYFWDHTTFGGARFHSTVTGGRLLLLRLGNLFLLLFTLGLGWPWVVARNARFACRYLTLDGALDLAGIEQEAQAASTIGEGLAGFLDVDFAFG